MKISVYGASSDKIDRKLIEITEELGRKMAEKGHSLVFGGGSQGLMGAAARGVHEKGGHILGIAPTFFKAVDGALYEHCDEFIYTETMRERKQLLEDHADGFIITPGGIGTYEEFFEVLTLKQLGRHEKPIVIYNMLGHYDTMNQMLEETIEREFMKPACRELYKFVTSAEEAFEYFDNYIAEKKESKEFKNI